MGLEIFGYESISVPLRDMNIDYFPELFWLFLRQSANVLLYLGYIVFIIFLFILCFS